MGLFIREALYPDVPQIVEGARQFFAYAKFASMGMPLNEQDFRNLISRYIDDPCCTVLSMMDGMTLAGSIAGQVIEYGFNRKIKMGIELYYWMFPPYRKGSAAVRLLSAFEDTMRAKGADLIVMISIPTELQEGIEKIYRRRNYQVLETFFIKGAGNGND